MSQSTLAIIILIITLILFVTQKLPLAVSALIGAFLMMAIGVLTPEDLCGYFGNYVPILLAGTGIVVGAIFETGLANKMGNMLIQVKFLTKSPKVFLITMVLAANIMSIFVANMPVVSLFLPLCATVAAASGGRIQKKYLYMAIGFAATMGGNGALIGSSINLTGQASLQEATGATMGMFTMLPITLVCIVVMVVYYATIGNKLQEKFFDFPEVPDTEDGGTEIEFKPVKAAISGITFVLMMVLFIKGIWNFGVVAILGAIICVVTGCISWKKALTKVDWNTVIIIAASLALAAGINKSGGGEVIANAVLSLCGGEQASPMLLLTVAIILASVLGCVMAHNAIVAIMVPIFCTIAVTLGVNPVVFAVAIVVACNNCFITPIGTAPVTMTLPAGYRFNDYVKLGTPLFILTDIALCIAMPLLYSF